MKMINIILLFIFLWLKEISGVKLKMNNNFIIEALNKDIFVNKKIFEHFSQGKQKDEEIHNFRKEIRENGIKEINNLSNFLVNNPDNIQSLIQEINNIADLAKNQ